MPTPLAYVRAILVGLLTLCVPAGQSMAATITPLTSPADFSAPVTTLNFDAAPGGTMANTLFAEQGITFSRDDGFAIPLLDWAALGHTTVSRPNVIATLAGPLGVPTSVPHLTVTFAAPTVELGAFFGNDNPDVGSFPEITLAVFDSNDTLVGAVTVPTNNNTHVDQFIGLRSDVPFVRARFANNATLLAVVLDNVSFSAPPLPVSHSTCLWGLYLDDHHSGGDWEARLFLANLDPHAPHKYQVSILVPGPVNRRSLTLQPNELRSLLCIDLNACGAAGGLQINSDAPTFGATLFMINTRFGGGAFTTPVGNCQFGLE